MFAFNNLKNVFTSRQKIDCVEFNDYPVFEIDGKKYYVDLENSRLTTDVERYLKTERFLTTTRVIDKEPELILHKKRTYLIPSSNKYLRLTVWIACELVDDEYYAITHLGVEKAVLLSTAFGVIEPETVEELK